MILRQVEGLFEIDEKESWPTYTVGGKNVNDWLSGFYLMARRGDKKIRMTIEEIKDESDDT